LRDTAPLPPRAGSMEGGQRSRAETFTGESGAFWPDEDEVSKTSPHPSIFIF
jgi:hypothetical protein